jgi:Scavenger mRNA decapping enzyme C-term binding
MVILGCRVKWWFKLKSEQKDGSKLGQMSNLTVLRRYAQMSKPESLPASVLLSHTTKSLALFDAYPKSIFHFLILPRLFPTTPVSDFVNLRTLLKSSKQRAKEVVLELGEHAKTIEAMIEDEMVSRFGFKWGIWVGFHAVPSMEWVLFFVEVAFTDFCLCRHVHLHVLSDDLCSPTMKNKKHYNSFHPKLGFFLHLDDVLEWLDAEPSYYDTVSDSQVTILMIVVQTNSLDVQPEEKPIRTTAQRGAFMLAMWPCNAKHSDTESPFARRMG